MNSIKTIPGEHENLPLHVELCAERFQSLDNKLVKLEDKIDKIANKVDCFRVEMRKTMIITMGSIVTTIITVMGVLLTKFF